MLEIVQEIGAVAGWAAVVGLAVLWALHVSQARDVKRLREWAGRAPERLGRDMSTVPGRAATAVGASAPPAVAPQPVRGAPTASPLHSQPWYTRIVTRYVAVALVGLLVLGAAATYGVTQLTGGGDASGNGVPKKPKRSAAAVNPGNVTVAVLNGTTVPGLAAALSDQIAAAGFQKGAIDDYSDKQLAESVVQYAPGHQAEAKAVSRRFGISQLEPVADSSRAIAGDATVIVVAGADKAPYTLR